MKWIRRLALAFLFVVTFSLVVAFAAWRMARRSPDWYTPRQADPREIDAAAGRAERRMIRTLNWAQEQRARARSSTAGPPESTEITFDEDELNGFFHKWDATFGWSRQVAGYISDPQIAVRGRELIFAATVAGSVLSVECSPRLRDGRLWISIDGVFSGRLPLPRVFQTGRRTKLEQAVSARLPERAAAARIDARRGANSDAVAAAMSELLIDILEDQPAPAALFLPSPGNGSRSLPVRVTDLRISDRRLTLTVEPMDSEGDQELLKTIRARVNRAPQP